MFWLFRDFDFVIIRLPKLLYFFFAALSLAQRARCAAAILFLPAAEILRRALPTTVSIETVLTPPSISMTRSIRAMSFRISAIMVSRLTVFSYRGCDRKEYHDSAVKCRLRPEQSRAILSGRGPQLEQ